MKCKFYFSLLLLFLSVLCSPAPTVNFSAPPFNPAQFLVDQAHNNISILGSSNTISSGVYPIKIFNLTGTNYFSIDSTGVPSGYILLTTNNTVAYFPFSSGTGGSGTLTNVVFTNAGPSDTYVIGNTSYLITNSFSGGGSAGTIYSFNTNDFSITGGTNVNLSSNIPHTNSVNTFYGTQTFPSRINVGIPALTVLQGNGSGSSANGAFSWTASGDVTGTSFTGNGSGLTTLNASSLSSGTVPVARLPVATSVALGVSRPDNTTITVSSGVLTAIGSASTVTNIVGGIGISVTQAGGTNFVAITGIVVTNSIYTNSGANIVINNTLFLNTNGFGGGSGGITALTGDVTASGSGSVVATLANIPTSTPMAGSLFDTAIVAPATPASGKGQIYEDSTSKNLAIKNDAGVINHGVQTRTATANQWIRSIADDGSSTISQPAFTDISGIATISQLPLNVVTNGVYTNSGPNVVLANTLFLNTNGFGGSGSSGLPTLGGNGTNETFWGFTQLTNSTSGNGVSFDGTSMLLDGVNLNTGPGGTIGGVGSGLVQLNASGLASGTVAVARLPVATSSTMGIMQPDNTTITISNGIIRSVGGGANPITNLVAGISRTFFFNSTNVATGTAGGVAVADMNGDGFPDIVGDAALTISVYTNNKLGTVFNRATTASAFSGFAGENAIEDVNGDGRNDVVICDPTSNFIGVWTNNGTGTLTQIGTNYPYFNPGFIVIGDFNMDGRMDFMACPAFGATNITIYTNNGSGVFSGLTNFPTGVAARTSAGVAFGDMNGDGFPDLVFTPNAGILIMTNNGSGVFATWFNGSTAAPYAPVIADFNGDGKLDYAYFTPSSGVSVYTNSGLGTFASYSFVALSMNPANGVVMVTADYNSDGLPDLAVACGLTGIVTITNSPLGFNIMSTNLVSGAAANLISTSDFNRDGQPDLAGTSSSGGGVTAVFLNNAIFTGKFQGDGSGVTNLNITLTSGTSSVVTTPAGVGVNIQLNTNSQPYLASGDTIYRGNLNTATNLSSTNINFGLFPIQTNFISGLLYVNIYNRPIQVQANVGVTTAAVTGDAGMALWIQSGLNRGTTNYESISTTVAVSLAMSYTNQLAGFIPTNAIYGFTNISSGAGNSAVLIGGQIY